MEWPESGNETVIQTNFLLKLKPISMKSFPKTFFYKKIVWILEWGCQNTIDTRQIQRLRKNHR